MRSNSGARAALLVDLRRLVFDAGMPDGTPRKLLDVSRLRALGWEPSIELAGGIAETYQSFLEEHVGTAG